MNKFGSKLENCSDIGVEDNGAFFYKKARQTYDNKEFGVGLTLIGFDENGEILAVSGWDWMIIKIKKDCSIETVGKLDTTLREISDNPDILLKQAKPMSIKEIEEKLGHKIIVKEMMNKFL